MKLVNVYNNQGKLISPNNRYEDPTEWIAHCVEKNEWGLPGEYTIEILDISDEVQAQERDKQASIIDAEFINKCSKIGVEFPGSFSTIFNEAVQNPYFQYDDVSRSRLQEVKDDNRVGFWRSVDDRNILLSNQQKNELYELLKLAYYTGFAESRVLIDALP